MGGFCLEFCIACHTHGDHREQRSVSRRRVPEAQLFIGSRLPDLSVHVVEALAVLAAPEVTDGDLQASCSFIGKCIQQGPPCWCASAILHEHARLLRHAEL